MNEALPIPLRRWAAGIAHSVARRLPPSIEVDDLIQVALLETWNAQRDFDGTRGVPFTAYAYRRVRGAILMSIRGRAYRDSTHEPLPLTEPGALDQDFDEVESRQLVDLLEHALQTLPERLQQAARWVWLHGQNTLDVARALNCSRGTVYSYLRQARSELLPQLKAMGLTGSVLRMDEGIDEADLQLEPGKCIPEKESQTVVVLSVSQFMQDYLNAERDRFEVIFEEVAGEEQRLPWE